MNPIITDSYLILHFFDLQYCLLKKVFVTVDKAIIKIKKIFQFLLSLNKIADNKITVAQMMALIKIIFFILM